MAHEWPCLASLTGRLNDLIEFRAEKQWRGGGRSQRKTPSRVTAERPRQAQGDPVGLLQDESSGWPSGVAATRGRVRRLQSLFTPGASVSWLCPMRKNGERLRRNPERSAVCGTSPAACLPETAPETAKSHAGALGRRGRGAQLCRRRAVDLGQAAQPLWASVLSSVKQDKPQRRAGLPCGGVSCEALACPSRPLLSHLLPPGGRHRA